MTIEIKEGRYFFAIWFFEFRLADSNGNLLGAAYRDAGKRDAEMIYRFRYYVDDKMDRTSKDRKNWYSGVLKADDEDELIAKLRESVLIMAVLGGCPAGSAFSFNVLKTDCVDEIAKTLQHPMMHKEVISKEEFERIKRMKLS